MHRQQQQQNNIKTYWTAIEGLWDVDSVAIMQITEEFLRKYSTTRSGQFGWNARQLSILGIQWPPRSGWIKRCIGKELTDEAAALFIECARKKVKPPPISNANQYNIVYHRDDVLDDEQRNHLRSILQDS